MSTNSKLYDRNGVQYKVREVMIKAFSSKFFLIITLILTLSFCMSVVLLFIQPFAFANLLGLIIPFLIMVGFWSIYNNTKNNEYVQTTGLGIIKGVLIFGYVILIIASVLIFIVGGFRSFSYLILSISLGIAAYAYYVFQKTITYIIDSFSFGSFITDYYNGTFIFLIISAVLTFLSAVLTYTGNLEYAVRDIVNLKTINYTSLQILIGVIGSMFTVLFYFLLAIFIFRLNSKMDKVHRYYGYDGAVYNAKEDILEDLNRKYDI